MSRRDSGVVVWFTGLPASGKSSLAECVQKSLAALGHAAVLLDGDALRPLLAPGLDYTPQDRAAFYCRLADLAGRLARQNLVILVAATAPLRSQRELARSLAPAFIEVYLDVARDSCEERDRKGLYARARAGAAPQLPGMGAAYEPPERPSVIAHGGHDEDAVDAIVRLITE